MRRALPVALLIAACAACAGAASPGALHAKLDAQLSCRIHLGLVDHVRPGSLFPIALQFENSGKARAITVESGPLVRCSATFSVPEADNVTHFLYLATPADITLGVRHLTLKDAETGRMLKRVDVSRWLGSLGYLGDVYGYDPSLCLALALSDGPAFAVNEDLYLGARFEVKRVSADVLPDRWAGYSGIDLMIVDYPVWTSPDFPAVPVTEWMAMGGRCLIVDAPAESRAAICRSIKAAGALFSMASDGSTFRVGIGGGAFVDRKFLTQAHSRESVAGVPGTLCFRPVLPYARHHGPEMPGVGEVPLLPVFVALALFAVAVGPVGWWYLVVRKKKGLLYYVAAPAVSALTVGLIVLADLLAEGVRPVVSCAAICLIDQQARKAIDLSTFGVYAPFPTNEQLHGEAGELPHLFSVPARFGGGWDVASYRMRTAGRRVEYPGVLPAREEAWFGREAFGVERRRVIVRTEGDKIMASNQLGEPLEKLLVARGGRYAKFGPLRPGATGQGKELSPAEFWREMDPIMSAHTAMRSGSTYSRKVLQCLARWKELIGDRGGFAAVPAGPPTAREVWLERFRPATVHRLILGVF